MRVQHVAQAAMAQNPVNFLASTRAGPIQAPWLIGADQLANEFWLNDRQWAALEPLIPMHRRGVKPQRNQEIISGEIRKLCHTPIKVAWHQQPIESAVSPLPTW
jgi:hypothetical protein